MAAFLVDRSLGRNIVPNALRANGHTVHTLQSVYGAEEQLLADTKFLRDAGRNGWAVLTADARIRYRPHELAVLQAERGRLFTLSSGNLTGADQARRFVSNMAAIERACRREGPFIYVVYESRIEKRWPDTTT